MMEFQGSQWESQFVTTNKRPIGPRMSKDRIDLTELEKRFEDGLNWDDSDTMDLITELKRCYAVIEEAQEYVRHLTATPDVLTMRLGKDLTTDNLRMSLEGLLVLLGADERSGYGSHSSEHQHSA